MKRNKKIAYSAMVGMIIAGLISKQTGMELFKVIALFDAAVAYMALHDNAVLASFLDTIDALRHEQE